MSVLLSASGEAVTDKRQLVEYFARGARPKAEWLIGVVHEKFPYRLSTLKPVSYNEPNGIRAFLLATEDYGWKPVMEDTTVIGLSRGRAAISLEPGGQVELAGAPFANLHEVAAELDQHLLEACAIGEKLGIGFLGMGFHPSAARDEIPWMPKQRYRIMRDYMPKKGALGLDMMLRTCTVQANLDYADEADAVRKMRVSLALQPIATALFASSPFAAGKPNGYASYRMHMWEDTDPERCGALPIAFENGFGFERYAEYALDIPMYFVWREGRYIDCAGQSFRDFLKGKLPALPGEIPTIGDWANHLTTLFPDVRLKNVIEMRGADCGSAEMMTALPAFWVGLLYDSIALDGAWELVKNWTPEERARLHAEVPRLGLNAEIDGRKVLEVARAAVALAQQGLRRRANRLHGDADETRYLDALFSITGSGASQADQLLMQFQNLQNFTMQKVFEACRLQPPPKGGAKGF